MAWSIPDIGEGDSNIQSVLFQEYLDAVVDGINGLNCVLSGFAVTGGADMTPAIAKGAALSNGVLFAVAAADVTITTADATNPRIDLVVMTSAGALAVRAGTAAAAPKPPARTANDVLLWAVYVPANDTAIGTSQCVDLRVIKSDATLKKVTTAAATNTTATIFTIFTLTVPNGLFLTGKVIKVRMGGNYLSNSGTPTWTLTISYGGTTMVADVTAATVADTDRKPWSLEFDLIAQANNDQAIVGNWSMGNGAAWTAATTGLTDFGNNTNLTSNPFSGAAAVDSDAANRDLLVRITHSVSNSAVETLLEYATAEII